MGYALFASRKIALTNELSVYQLQLDRLQQQKMNLLNYSAAIADGYISADEFADNPGCLSQFNNFYNNAWNNNAGNQALANNAATSAQDAYSQQHGGTLTAEQQIEFNAIPTSTMQSVIQEYAKNVESRRTAAIENQLDMQMKKLETKITAIQQELQSVENAEKQGIQNATPKYAGLG